LQVAAVAVGSCSIGVSLTSFDANPANDAASLSFTVSPSVADVTLSVSGTPYARIKNEIDYQIHLSSSVRAPPRAAGRGSQFPASS
jgi:hypothetical protein